MAVIMAAITLREIVTDNLSVRHMKYVVTRDKVILKSAHARIATENLFMLISSLINTKRTKTPTAAVAKEEIAKTLYQKMLRSSVLDSNLTTIRCITSVILRLQGAIMPFGQPS
jgi:hypothetical protein